MTTIIRSFTVKRKITLVMDEEAHVVFIEYPEPHNHDGPHALTEWFEYTCCEMYRECVVHYCRYYEVADKDDIDEISPEEKVDVQS